MKLRDRMIYGALVMSDLKRRHPKAYVREFYRDLLHVCDDHGRFEANAGLLRAVLYAPILDRVSERDVEGYLRQLAAPEHADIKLYIVKGRRYGKVTKWRQHLLRRLEADYPAEDGEPELDLTVDPPLLNQKEGRKEGGSAAAPAPAPARPVFKVESEQHWLERVAEAWPGIDLRSELAKAHRDRTAKGKALERHWFEKHWLPGCSPIVSRGGPAPVASAAESEPYGWRDWVNENCPDSPYARGGDKEGTAWLDLDAGARRYLRDQVTRPTAA